MAQRFNRWIHDSALRDVERICANRAEHAQLIRLTARWLIDALALDPNKKGESRADAAGVLPYRRWSYGPLTVLFRLLPDDDRTVIIEGFIPNES